METRKQKNLKVARTSVRCLGCIVALWLTASVAAIAANPVHRQRESLSAGPVEIEISIQPDPVPLHRDALLTLKITAPETVDLDLPASLADRLQGFELRGDRSGDPIARDGTILRQRQLLLSPVVAREYRLAPFAIAYTDQSQPQPQSGWLTTQPVVFPMLLPPAGSETDDTFDPVRIWPGPRTWALYGLVALGLAAVGYGLWHLTKRARQAIRVWRMSPRERALKELGDLMARKLVEQGRIKEFYLELTLVVRRYIERAHKIRAPEQTTQEFLSAASESPRFSPEALARLSRFLEAADLVKFAAHQPPQEDIDAACQTARGYIETDADATDGTTAERTRHV